MDMFIVHAKDMEDPREHFSGFVYFDDGEEEQEIAVEALIFPEGIVDDATYTIDGKPLPARYGADLGRLDALTLDAWRRWKAYVRERALEVV